MSYTITLYVYLFVIMPQYPGYPAGEATGKRGRADVKQAVLEILVQGDAVRQTCGGEAGPLSLDPPHNKTSLAKPRQAILSPSTCRPEMLSRAVNRCPLYFPTSPPHVTPRFPRVHPSHICHCVSVTLPRNETRECTTLLYTLFFGRLI